MAESSRDNSSVSHLACLRQRYKTSRLSAEASELMLILWRTKSSQSYESLFRKWAHWCYSRWCKGGKTPYDHYRLLKGAYYIRPPLPRYTVTWDVQLVLQYIEGLGPFTSLSLKLLTFNLVNHDMHLYHDSKYQKLILSYKENLMIIIKQI